MEIVVFRSDIARLVLGYLKKEQLNKASQIFCKTSPHLTEEFSAYKQGLQSYSFFPDLEEIICEYVKITQKVDHSFRQLPDSMRVQLQFKKLSDKVNVFLNLAVQHVLSEKNIEIEGSNPVNKIEGENTNNLNSDKENSESKTFSSKRKREHDSLINTSSEQKDDGRQHKYRKYRRSVEPFCFLGWNDLEKLKKISPGESSSDENSIVMDDYIAESFDEHSDEGETIELEKSAEISDGDTLGLEKPTKESTPRNKFSSGKYQSPMVPEISQAILDNPDFQTKLVQNINEALKSTSTTNEIPITSDQSQIISSNQLLDEMIKNILDVTEKDPTFDAIVQEVVGSHKSHVSTAVQCDMLLPIEDKKLRTQTELLEEALQLPKNVIANDNAINISSIGPPQTPLIIRNAVAASHSVNSDVQTLPVLPANTSFGSLIDPNFSISKLIVLNSNDSAQKQHPDSHTNIGNITAENLLTQLNSGISESPLDDQVHLDVASGQLTFPLFLTNDGLLTNFPFLINNEIVTQQLQPDNIANLDSSRIEISLPEPIIVTADQLPPNSKISGSTQKISIVEMSQNNAQKTVNKIKANTLTAVPSSLDSRLYAERSTPSTCGIVNSKAYKSLSTPRKRASHVRTLTFSPKSSTGHTTSALITPLSTRRETFKRLPKSIPEERKEDALVSEKPIIKNIEILPRIAGSTTLDSSANESSNSCNVPPLFVAEECSNQTIIKCDFIKTKGKNLVTGKSKTMDLSSEDTPKRKQVRKNAVRACKRQLSKSPNEEIHQNVSEESKGLTNTKENRENEKNLSVPKNLSDDGNDKSQTVQDDLMEEWVRMRNASTSNLDSRLREINASKGFIKPVKRTIKKKVRRRKEATIKPKKQSLTKVSINMEKEDVKDKTVGLNNVSANPENKANISSDNEHKVQTEIQKEFKDKRKVPKEKQKEFNIKILTPQKPKEKRTDFQDVKSELKKNQNSKDLIPNNSLISFKESEFSKSALISNVCLSPGKECLEREKRSANIACLLETPLKDPIIETGAIVPPTPGLFAHSLDTPLSKIRPMVDEINTTTFLFGSLTKSELDTPMLSAITPGFRFTPFSSKDATPRSVAATEYSSGGSYYRPDESDDLDKNIDKMAKCSTQTNSIEVFQSLTQMKEAASLVETDNRINESDACSNAVSVENAAVTTIKVEPIVLKRIKSFDNDDTDTIKAATIAKVDPHYTLVSGLPELSAVEDESSSSSSGSSSTTSSSRSSSSGSSSSSSSSSGSESKPNTNTKLDDMENKDLIKTLSVEHLSEISSAEDEDWQKLAVTDCEDSQLIANDGEVRYPVRSWLTPHKKQNVQSTTKVARPLASTEKRNQQHAELKEKRDRLKEKLRSDLNKHTNQKPVKPSCSKAAIAATRSLQAMHKTSKLKSSVVKPVLPQSLDESKKSLTSKAEEETRTLEVLTALHLSAKKNPPNLKDKAPDNNTLSFETEKNKVEKSFVEVKTSDSKEVAKKGNTQKTCLQIEARAITKPKRTNADLKTKRNLKVTKNTETGFDKIPKQCDLLKSTKTLELTPKLFNSRRLRVSPRLGKMCSKREIPKKTIRGRKPILSPKIDTNTKTVVKQLEENIGSSDQKKLACSVEEKSREEIIPEEQMNIKSEIIQKDSDDARSAGFIINDSEINVSKVNSEKLMDKNACVNEMTKTQLPSDEIAVEDLLEECGFRSSSDNEKNYIQITYDESKQINKSPAHYPTSEMSKFSMCLEIEGHKIHTLKVCDEICLFNFDPIINITKERSLQSIKNIPKKRRIRITTSDDSDSTTKNCIKFNEKPKSIDDSATSSVQHINSITTPIVETTRSDVTHRLGEESSCKETGLAKTITATSSATAPDFADHTLDKQSGNAADKIKFEDIENILSQLHGA